MSTGKPTYWPTDTNKIPDLIDFFIVRNISTNFITIDEGWDMNSDHSPIMLTMSENIIKKEPKPILVNKYTDWISFKTDLENTINLAVRPQNEQQLDEQIEILINNIQQAAWNNTPSIKKRTVGNNYPKEIKELIKEKKKIKTKVATEQSASRQNNIK